ncbi:hypothetical protein REPUB_Repub01dG0021100 [Reevesia pubescens]
MEFYDFGFSQNGNSVGAISLFDQMYLNGLEMNVVTFLSVLEACFNLGYLDNGKCLHHKLLTYGVRTNLYIDTALIDMYAKCGDLLTAQRVFDSMSEKSVVSGLLDMEHMVDPGADLNEAYGIIKSMPFAADASIWSALLNGCRIHHRIDIIKGFEQKLLDVNTDDSGYYTLLSNIYAEEGIWKEFMKVRSVMKGIGLRKVPGYNIIELDNKVYRFGVGDTSLLQTEETQFFGKFPKFGSRTCL